MTCVVFSIKFAKTNQKFAENSEFCEKNSLLFRIIHFTPRSIHNPLENEFAASLTHGASAWIGGYLEAGTFGWADRSAVTYQNSAAADLSPTDPAGPETASFSGQDAQEHADTGAPDVLTTKWYHRHGSGEATYLCKKRARGRGDLSLATPEALRERPLRGSRAWLAGLRRGILQGQDADPAGALRRSAGSAAAARAVANRTGTCQPRMPAGIL